MLLAGLAPEQLIFAIAGLISLLAFTVLILAPAIGSFSRGWEKATAALLSVFILVALIAIGIGSGLLIVYHWDAISSHLP